MLSPVNFNRKSKLYAEEVENKRPELMLTTELHTGDLSTPQQHPE
jgi:hypothetical protein